MATPMKLLHLEDNPHDAELVKELLMTEGLECQMNVVANEADFTSALERGDFDLILSDFSIPAFSGRTALFMAHAKCPDVPYIFFSGTIGEEAAVQALKDGATDYVLKHKIANLVPAIKRALSEAWERTERKRAEEELRKTEAQLRQAQKLEGIGQLAGGIAHDFNNLLTVINGYGELALKILPRDHEVRPQIEQIREAGRRAAALTQQILAFSRKQQLNAVVFNVNDTVQKMQTLLRRLIGEDIVLLTSTEAKLWQVKADEGQIEQVIMNLAVNARDAMPQGGTLTIETQNIELDEGFARMHVLPKAGAYVKLTVRDTGCGMDEATKARIFEPFFTTKGPDKGTGLGLATVYGIVHQSGGTIVVDSTVGQGTAFGVYLPQALEEAHSLPEKSPSQDSCAGEETVLLVEDEDVVRTLVRQILRGQGYTVLEARNGKEALNMSAKHASPIDLLLTDLVMPGMTGRQVAATLKLLRPTLKVMYMSGYIERQQQGPLEPGSVLIQKPFSYDALVQKVRQVLDTKLKAT